MALSGKQLELLEIQMAYPQLPYKEMAELAGISERTCARWRNETPEYKAEFERRLDEKWNGMINMAIETMASLARGGDYKAAEYILKTSRKYSPVNKAEVTGNLTTTINISITDEEDGITKE